ncbi:MAG: radical SAM protein [Bacteroidales bacterium]|nr:radical SAM protein [Bacteroidales bacterium]
MERYSIIHSKFPREFVLLQGTGCKWKRCTFCDYHNDISENPFEINKYVLSQITGQYGVLDIINSGSGLELDSNTINLIKQIIAEKDIHTIWFEMHYMYRNNLFSFAKQFSPAKVKFRCGIETFDANLRNKWNKGISSNVTVGEIAQYFNGVCLLCGTKGESKERIIKDIILAKQHFEYISINLFNENSTAIAPDKELQQWFISELYPKLKLDSQIEILINNNDLGVG